MTATDDSLKGLYALAEIWREEVKRAVAAERSECAKIIEAKWQEARDTEFDLGFETARKCFAAAIRARGQT